MKCRMAVFDHSPYPDIIMDSGGWEQVLPVECGGEIMGNYTQEPIPDNPMLGYLAVNEYYYCDKCGVRYEKLPEE